MPVEVKKSEFRKELEVLINKHSKENGSDTPDWILAGFLENCLNAFDVAAVQRHDWYNGGNLDKCG